LLITYIKVTTNYTMLTSLPYPPKNLTLPPNCTQGIFAKENAGKAEAFVEIPIPVVLEVNVTLVKPPWFQLIALATNSAMLVHTI